jgi:hypothetical protein
MIGRTLAILLSAALVIDLAPLLAQSSMPDPSNPAPASPTITPGAPQTAVPPATDPTQKPTATTPASGDVHERPPPTKADAPTTPDRPVQPELKTEGKPKPQDKPKR